MMFVITSIVFFMVRFVPGDPARIMVGGQRVTETNLAAIRKQYRLDKPLLTQYRLWVVDLAHGDLGRSFRQRQDVRVLITDRLPVTFKLAVLSFVISLLISLPLGILAAVRRNSWVDVSATGFSLIGASSPVFFTSIILILTFSYKLNVMPALGRGDGGLDTVKHLIMPAFALGFSLAAITTRITRASMVEALTQDYIETARSKGLSSRSVVLKHAFRNALIPIVTVAGLQFGYLLVGTVLVDYTFGLGGLGALLIDSVQRRDYPVVQGMTIFIAALFIVINLVTDVLYGVIDPRVRYGGRA
jgi:peptide/nickel transport system permease protein